jgi:hypothetical protein
LIALVGFVGLGLTSNSPPPLPAIAAVASSTPAVAFVPRPSPWAVPVRTPDPASFEGSSALAASDFVIPPPRWLTGRRPAVSPTTPLHGASSRRIDRHWE